MVCGLGVSVLFLAGPANAGAGSPAAAGVGTAQPVSKPAPVGADRAGGSEARLSGTVKDSSGNGGFFCFLTSKVPLSDMIAMSSSVLVALAAAVWLAVGFVRRRRTRQADPGSG